MLIEIRDNVIWARHLERDPSLHDEIVALGENETVRLRVDGIVGTWAKMRSGADGRPTLGIRPVGAMASVWARLQKRRGEKVLLERPSDTPGPLLERADRTFEEWYSAEDEEAYGELRPI